VRGSNKRRDNTPYFLFKTVYRRLFRQLRGRLRPGYETPKSGDHAIRYEIGAHVTLIFRSPTNKWRARGEIVEYVDGLILTTKSKAVNKRMSRHRMGELPVRYAVTRKRVT